RAILMRPDPYIRTRSASGSTIMALRRRSPQRRHSLLISADLSRELLRHGLLQPKQRQLMMISKPSRIGSMGLSFLPRIGAQKSWNRANGNGGNSRSKDRRCVATAQALGESGLQHAAPNF